MNSKTKRAFYLHQLDALPALSKTKTKTKTKGHTKFDNNANTNARANTNADPVRKLLFSKVLDRFFLCAEKGICTFTDFLDPNNRATFERLLCGSKHEGKHTGIDTGIDSGISERAIYLVNDGSGVVLRAYGGAPDNECERKMLGFSPLGFTPSQEALRDDVFPITRLRVAFNTKFHTAPRHKDLLGALLGLGIDRSRVGDIFVSSQYATVLVHTEISEYVITQFEKAGKVPVKVTRLADPSVGVLSPDEDASSSPNETTLIVASLRLDAVVAAAFRLSRSQAVALVAAEKVFINWIPISDASKTLRENDCVTVRGQGRVQIVGMEGKTKKDRVRLTVAVFK